MARRARELKESGMPAARIVFRRATAESCSGHERHAAVYSSSLIETTSQQIGEAENVADEAQVRRRRKILHIVGCMSRGGVETWLMHILRNIDRNRFELHFFVNSETECAYDKEILSLGGQIHYGGHPGNLPQYAREFASVVRSHGPFDVVHSHVSGLVDSLRGLADKLASPSGLLTVTQP